MYRLHENETGDMNLLAEATTMIAHTHALYRIHWMNVKMNAIEYRTAATIATANEGS